MTRQKRKYSPYTTVMHINQFGAHFDFNFQILVQFHLDDDAMSLADMISFVTDDYMLCTLFHDKHVSQ